LRAEGLTHRLTIGQRAKDKLAAFIREVRQFPNASTGEGEDRTTWCSLENQNGEWDMQPKSPKHRALRKQFAV